MDAPDPQDMIHLLSNISTQLLVIAEDLRGFNREQVAINQRLETLLHRLLPPSTGGH